jgi:hypothetical protein
MLTYSFKMRLGRCLPIIFKMKGETRRTNEITKKIAAVGRLRNINGLPLDKIKDWRNAFSNMGPKTKAKTRGAGS